MDYPYTYTVQNDKDSACPPKVLTEHFTTLYDISDLLYVAAKAVVGELQRICVKDIILTAFNGTLPVFVYRDTTNRVWRENELITLDAAQEYIDFYKTWLANQQSQWNQSNCPSVIVVPPIIKYN